MEFIPDLQFQVKFIKVYALDWQKFIHVYLYPMFSKFVKLPCFISVCWFAIFDHILYCSEALTISK